MIALWFNPRSLGAAPLKLDFRSFILILRVMNLAVPDEFLELFDRELPSDMEVSIRLAAQLYASGKISVAKAAGLAGMKRWEFEDWLSRHNVSIPLSADDLDRELEVSADIASGTD